ncbi:maleylpyruvate isomerase family mycothiol-dependent enzyme [Fodinicola feengrottensis]
MTTYPAARRQKPDRDQAANAAEAEGDAILAVLRRIGDHWQQPTDCVGWSVRDITAHLVGQAEDLASLFTVTRRIRHGRRHFPDRIELDALTAQQIADHTEDSGPQLVTAFATAWPRALRSVRRMPAVIRNRTIRPGIPDPPRWTIGYLQDIIYSRDLWMHRVDLCRATDQPMVFDDHDRWIVNEVIRDLAASWTGPAVTLELTGPAGDKFQLGDSAPTGHVRADAVDFLRGLSGRPVDHALAARNAPAVRALQTARVTF